MAGATYLVTKEALDSGVYSWDQVIELQTKVIRRYARKFHNHREGRYKDFLLVASAN